MSKLKNLLFATILCILIAFQFSTVQASSASISANKQEVAVGETVTITVTVNGAAWQIHLSGAINENFADATENAENKSVSKTFQFTPSAPGTYTINMSGNTAEGSDGATSDTSGSVTIVAKENVATPTATSQTEEGNKSNNSKLSNLGITPNDFKGFTPNKTSYDVTVPNDCASVNIYANKGHNGQTITGVGKKDLQEGVNQFSIVVTAEDGTTKTTYNLSITREAKDGEEKPEENTVEDEKAVSDEEQKVGLSKLTIDGITLSPEFKKDVYEYTAKLIGDKTELDVQTTAIDEGQIIEVIGNKDLQEGENVITILVKSADEKETVTYQITVKKSLVDEEAIAREKAEEEMQKQKRQQRLIIIGIIVVAIVIIGIILLVRYIRKRRGYEMEYYEDDEDEFDMEDEEEQEPKALYEEKLEKENEEKEENIEEEMNNGEEDIQNQENTTEQEEYPEYEEEEKPHRRRSKGKRFKD